MGIHYSHFTLSERWLPRRELDRKTLVAAIAALLGKHRASLYREIRRNFHHTAFRGRWGHAFRGYFCTTAHRAALRRRACQAKLARRPDLPRHVAGQLAAGWSPQQVAGRMRLGAGKDGAVSHESIYRFVYGPGGAELGLPAPLASQRRPRGRRRWLGPIPQRHWTDNRPVEVASRESFGHWEGDLVTFAREHGKANVTSLVERASRHQVLLANPDRCSVPLVARIAGVLSALPPAARRTVTFDRGSEFLAYRALPADCYFCNPNSPWQRGAAGNANGRLRRHLPLPGAPDTRDQGALQRIADRVNATPRRCLGYRTPADVFADKLAKLAAGD